MRVRAEDTTGPCQGRSRQAWRAGAVLALGAGLVLPGASGAAAEDDVVTLGQPSPACVATPNDTSTVTLDYDGTSWPASVDLDVEVEDTPDRGVNEGFTVTAWAGQSGTLATIPLKYGYSTRVHVRAYTLVLNPDGSSGYEFSELLDETRTVPLCETSTPTPTSEPTTPAPSPSTSAEPTPSTSVQPVDESALTDASRGSVSVPTSAARGTSVTVNVGTALAGEQVSAWIYSTPTALGQHTVAADGTISVTVPSSLAAGAHRIAVLNNSGTLVGWDDITITAGTNAVPKAATGLDEGTSNSGATLVDGALVVLVVAGIAAALIRRRARTAA